MRTFFFFPTSVLLLLPAATNGFLMCSMVPESIDMHYGCFVTEPTCPNSNVTFWLYTRETQDNPRELDLGRPRETIRPDYFKPNAPLVVLIHGYTGHRDFSPNTEIRPAYLSTGDYNIISVDYGPLAKQPCYFSGVRNLPVVANCTAQLLDYIEQNQIMDMAAYHVIGFSLGGQVAGMINTFKRTRMPRITALDPAKPCFIDAQKEWKIDDSDAKFVSVIHTDVFARGILSAIGHVDFYINGGFNQPGCKDSNGDFGSCNHARAPMYYAESITSDKGFWGYQCRDWYDFMSGACRESEDTYLLMGDETPEDARGSYFITTNSLEPFAKGRNVGGDDFLIKFFEFLFPPPDEVEAD